MCCPRGRATDSLVGSLWRWTAAAAAHAPSTNQRAGRHACWLGALQIRFDDDDDDGLQWPWGLPLPEEPTLVELHASDLAPAPRGRPLNRKSFGDRSSVILTNQPQVSAREASQL